MRPTITLVLLSVLLQAPVAALAQEVAGRILIAVGDVTLTRDGRTVPASTGTDIRAGDSMQLGPQSNAQLRFTDDSVVALRPETTFRITEYAFQDREPALQRAFFNLVRGGMRTVTGTIGRIQRTNYGVVTPSVSVGIRGTNYTLVECDGNCRNPDGSLAPNGAYGAVTDGRIAVTNQTGEVEFGADQYFYAAGAATAPIRLIAPPSFVRDALDARVRARERQEQEKQARAQQGQQERAGAGSAGTESAAAVAVGDSRVSSAVVSATAPAATALTTNVYQVTTEAAVEGPGTILQPMGTGTVYFRLDSSAGNVELPVVNCPPGSDCARVRVGDITLGINYSTQRAYFTTSLADTVDGRAVNFSTPANSGGIPVTLRDGQVTFGATNRASDYPTQQGAFRCEACVADRPGVAESVSISGVIRGNQAIVTLTARFADGDGGSVNATLTQQAPPSGLVAVMAIPNKSSGTGTGGAFGWAVGTDSTGRLVKFGPEYGFRRAAVGSATNKIAGSAPAAGNLVWGSWTGAGASITDSNYESYVTTAGAFIPWVTGTATNTLPPGLGTSVTYSPVGSLVNDGTGVLNRAALTANFVAATVAIDVNATNPGAGNTFQMNGVSGFSTVNGRFGAAFDSVTCTGRCVGGAPSGSYQGFFAGPNAEGAGLAFSAGFGLGSGVTGVAAFKR